MKNLKNLINQLKNHQLWYLAILWVSLDNTVLILNGLNSTENKNLFMLLEEFLFLPILNKKLKDSLSDTPKQLLVWMLAKIKNTLQLLKKDLMLSSKSGIMLKLYVSIAGKQIISMSNVYLSHSIKNIYVLLELKKRIKKSYLFGNQPVLLNSSNLRLLLDKQVISMF